MTRPGPNSSPAVRVLPSLTDFAFLMPVFFLFAGMGGAKTLLGDGDTGWHVRTGEWILSHGRVPNKDLFSFTKTGQPWFAWEWLWDVIFAWLHQHWGMASVVVASVLVISATSALVFRLSFKKCGNPLIALAATFLAMAGSALGRYTREYYRPARVISAPVRDRGRNCGHGRERSYPRPAEAGGGNRCRFRPGGRRRDVLPHHADRAGADRLLEACSRLRANCGEKYPANRGKARYGSYTIRPDI